MDYGYARVSAKDQSLARQLDALRELGLSDDAIFTDKASGKDFNRPHFLDKRTSVRKMGGFLTSINLRCKHGRSLKSWR